MCRSDKNLHPAVATVEHEAFAWWRGSCGGFHGGRRHFLRAEKQNLRNGADDVFIWELFPFTT